ncbi:hypothetical protein V2G26_016595 [Clonostachys chloroleuca]
MVAAELCPPILHADTPPPCDGEALLGPGASQDTTIVIPEDSDAEDDGYGEKIPTVRSHTQQLQPASQSILTAWAPKQLNRGGCRNHYGNYATESQVGVEGDAVRVYGSHLDPSA